MLLLPRHSYAELHHCHLVQGMTEIQQGRDSPAPPLMSSNYSKHSLVGCHWTSLSELLLTGNDNYNLKTQKLNVTDSRLY